ncbi:TPA: hypothetical protein DCW56_01405 [Candidatus Peregrinibacteria bacterium]|nr:hypothetical protein [Candidatus Peregrinibacteria bacterium]
MKHKLDLFIYGVLIFLGTVVLRCKIPPVYQDFVFYWVGGIVERPRFLLKEESGVFSNGFE